MYTIIYDGNSYFHDEGKIILFKSQQEANDFINIFIQYSINRFAQEGQDDEIMMVPMQVMTRCRIAPVDFEIEKVKCGTIFASELYEKWENNKQGE